MGLHARRQWLEDGSASQRRAERDAVRRILRHQRADGSLGGIAGTIRGLYALHLLRRERTQELDRALDWLWEASPGRPGSRGKIGQAPTRDLLLRVPKGDVERFNLSGVVPFTRGCAGFIKTAAGVLLAALLGRGREGRVLRAIRALDAILDQTGGLWCSPACASNVLRAYVFHPDASRGRGTGRAVRALGRLQTARGSWRGMPFASTFNILAHVDSREAKAQVRRALPLVKRLQNADGSWGRGPNREHTSFFVVQAVRRFEA
jgi:hypothetical protein